MKYIRSFAIVTLYMITIACMSSLANAVEWESIKSQKGQEIFSSASSQSMIPGYVNLAAIAKTNSIVGSKASSLGFAAKSDESKFFLIGALYSEALAYQRGGDSNSAAKALAAIEEIFIELGAPSSLYNYISKTQHVVERGKYPKEAILDMLSLFQPFFDEYAEKMSKDKQTLFRAGSWLADMALTASVGDVTLLKQPTHLEYILNEMKRMDAPQGVIKALERIHAITAKKTVEKHDTKAVLRQVKKIQAILG